MNYQKLQRKLFSRANDCRVRAEEAAYTARYHTSKGDHDWAREDDAAVRRWIRRAERLSLIGLRALERTKTRS